MSLTLYAHPFSSYCWKVLIALYENDTPFTLKMLANLHPIGRLGTADEVAELALWLNSDKASFVTGSYYNVDGGYLAQ